MKFGRIKRQHGRVGGLDDLLDLIVRECPHVTRIIPGRIKRRRGKTPPGFKVQYPTEAGLKCLYTGTGSFSAKGTPDEVAIQESVNTRQGVERCVRYAFDLASHRPRRHLTLCGKTNVLTYAWDLWARVFEDVGSEYPAVETAYAHVDAACLWMVEDPGRFDVIVTDNMFGDIITDLGAAIQGGMGIASGANLSPGGVSMFEPIGGTAPGFEGTGQINPLAAIGAAAMMLAEIGETAAGAAVEEAVGLVAGSLPSLRAGQMGATTKEIGDRVVEVVSNAR